MSDDELQRQAHAYAAAMVQDPTLMTPEQHSVMLQVLKLAYEQFSGLPDDLGGQQRSEQVRNSTTQQERRLEARQIAEARQAKQAEQDEKQRQTPGPHQAKPTASAAPVSTIQQAHTATAQFMLKSIRSAEKCHDLTAPKCANSTESEDAVTAAEFVDAVISSAGKGVDADIRAAKAKAKKAAKAAKVQAEIAAKALKKATNEAKVEAAKVAKAARDQAKKIALAARVEDARAKADKVKADKAFKAAQVKAKKVAKAARVEAASLEAANIAADKLAEAARVEAQKVAKAAKVKANKVAKAEAARVKAQKVAMVEAARLEAASLEAASLEAASLEAASLEAASLEAASLEAARLEAARLEAARVTIFPEVLECKDREEDRSVRGGLNWSDDDSQSLVRGTPRHPGPQSWVERPSDGFTVTSSSKTGRTGSCESSTPYNTSSTPPQDAPRLEPNLTYGNVHILAPPTNSEIRRFDEAHRVPRHLISAYTEVQIPIGCLRPEFISRERVYACPMASSSRYNSKQPRWLPCKFAHFRTPDGNIVVTVQLEDFTTCRDENATLYHKWSAGLCHHIECVPCVRVRRELLYHQEMRPTRLRGAPLVCCCLVCERWGMETLIAPQALAIYMVYSGTSTPADSVVITVQGEDRSYTVHTRKPQ
jgi:hypothetical protein